MTIWRFMGDDGKVYFRFDAITEGSNTYNFFYCVDDFTWYGIKNLAHEFMPDAQVYAEKFDLVKEVALALK